MGARNRRAFFAATICAVTWPQSTSDPSGYCWFLPPAFHSTTQFPLSITSTCGSLFGGMETSTWTPLESRCDIIDCCMLPPWKGVGMKWRNGCSGISPPKNPRFRSSSRCFNFSLIWALVASGSLWNIWCIIREKGPSLGVSSTGMGGVLSLSLLLLSCCCALFARGVLAAASLGISQNGGLGGTRTSDRGTYAQSRCDTETIGHIFLHGVDLWARFGKRLCTTWNIWHLLSYETCGHPCTMGFCMKVSQNDQVKYHLFGLITRFRWDTPRSRSHTTFHLSHWTQDTTKPSAGIRSQGQNNAWNSGKPFEWSILSNTNS